MSDSDFNNVCKQLVRYVYGDMEYKEMDNQTIVEILFTLANEIKELKDASTSNS